MKLLPRYGVTAAVMAKRLKALANTGVTAKQAAKNLRTNMIKILDVSH